MGVSDDEYEKILDEVTEFASSRFNDTEKLSREESRELWLDFRGTCEQWVTELGD